jgi:hypothetical protein
VIAAWLIELAIHLLEAILAQGPQKELITLEDLGIARVRIGRDS